VPTRCDRSNVAIAQPIHGSTLPDSKRNAVSCSPLQGKRPFDRGAEEQRGYTSVARGNNQPIREELLE
jgi:hypothetical protein